MKVLLLICVLARIADADPVALPNSKALFDVPKTWVKQPDGAEPIVGAWKKGASTLVVTRVQVPNTSAWIKASRVTYAKEVEAGALGAVGGTKKLARAFADINGVPTLDLELKRPDGTQLVIRILLFRTYSLAATIQVPKGGALDEARSITKKLTAPKP